MTSTEPADLRAALLSAKTLLIYMQLHEARLAVAGSAALDDWEGYADGAASLGSLELRLARAVALAKEVAPDIQDKLKSFAEKSPLALQAAEILVNVQIANAHRLDGDVIVLARKTASIFSYFAGGGFVKKLFSKKPDLPIKQMIVDIDRLLPFVDALQVAVAANAPPPEPAKKK